MKNFKRTVAAVMTSALLLTPCVASMSMNAFAAGDVYPGTSPYTVTITNSAKDELNHSFEIYQIFSGTLDTYGKLAEIDWADGVDSAKLLTALKNSVILDEFTESSYTAQQVADKIGTYGYDSAKAIEFAKLVGQNLKNKTTNPGNQNGATVDVLKVTSMGYYFVKDVTDSATSGNSLSRPILKVLGDVNVTTKVTLPELHKKFSDGTMAKTPTVGDIVEYKITAPIPNMTGYDKYYYIVHDRIDNGLTLQDKLIEGNTNGFTISVGDTDLTRIEKTAAATASGAKYYVEECSDSDCSFKIVFVDFAQYKSEAGNVVITYSAKLNSNADLTTKGNWNKAHLQYSNNPNVDYDGWYTDNLTDPEHPKTPDDPSDDKPGPDHPDYPDDPTTPPPTGDTPEEGPVAYATKLSIVKYKDSVSDTNKLPGVTFALYKGTDTSGTAWLTDITGENGTITFKGLGTGTYTLKEVSGYPGGYNPIEDITFTVGATIGEDHSLTKWSSDKEIIKVGDTVNDGLNAQIVNKSGSTLPSTGGIGTTLFYVIGGMLVVGSSVVLVTKKRMSAEKK